jgi:cytochrome P450
VAIGDPREHGQADALFLRFFEPETRADPYPLYHELRARDPIHRSPVGVWVLTRYSDATTVLRDPRFSVDLRKAKGAWFLDNDGIQERLERRSKVMLFADPPDHDRLRSLVNKAFSARVVDSLRARAQEIVDECLDRVATRGHMEVIADLAYPLPVTIIAEMLGVPPEDHERFQHWSRNLTKTLDPLQPPDVYEAIESAAVSFEGYFSALIEEHRSAPRDDLLSALLEAEDAGDRLTHEELITMCVLILIAGHETTVNLIGNGMLALLRHQDQLKRLRDDPTLIAGAVEEFLRYDGTVQLTGRTATADVEVDGTVIREGELSLVLIGAGNRDPARFEHPDSVDIERENNKHLAFGGGPHFCLGAPLARIEAQIAIGTLVQRFEEITLAQEPQWRPQITLRGLENLPIEFRA